MAERSIQYWTLRGAFSLSRHVPLSWRYSLGTLGGEAVYWCWPSKRRNTLRNMTVVTGDCDGARASTLARASLREYGRYLIDFLNLPNVTAAEIIQRVHAYGWEHLDKALDAGKGVIFVTGHFGIWDYAPCVLANRYPGRMHVVAESFESPHIDALIQGQRTLKGSTVIAMDNVRQMVRALRGNGILALLVDRPVHGDGVPVEFFGRHTLVPAGAATLAAMTGAAVLPGYLIHRKDGDYDGHILPPIQPSAVGDRATDVQIMTQRIFTALERIIVRSPRNWYMFRDMWVLSGMATGEVEAPA